ncbi:MAG: DUF2066 domain-containing protein [Kangiellaceae bacterium]|nr:DUF2066 domain-containing protein [Kangiellaceae bacterium]
MIACCFALLGFVSSSKAVEVADLYLVKWPVTDQNKTTRKRAVLAGFKEVLVRISGSQQILRDGGVQQAYRKVTSYLQRLQYIHQNDANEEYPYLISLYFEPRLIDALIRDAKLPLWGSSRPLTVLWLAVETDNERQIVSASSNTRVSVNAGQKAGKSAQLFEIIESNATRRGLPLITPLMDLEDELVVSPSDVWGRFSLTINQASQRYFADSVLIGRMQQLGEQWRAQFTYINQGKELAFVLMANSQELLIADLTDKLAELLCNKYCVVEQVGETNEVMLHLSGINNFVEYKAAEEYLENLSALRKLYLIGIAQHTLKIKVSLLGDLESLIKGISLGNQMSVVDIEDRLPELRTVPHLLEDELQIQTEEVNVTTKAKDSNGDLMDTEENEIKNSLETLYYRWNG